MGAIFNLILVNSIAIAGVSTNMGGFVNHRGFWRPSQASPSDIPSLLQWYDAQDTATVYQDSSLTTLATTRNQTVAGIKDKKGTLHCVQANGSYTPKLIVDPRDSRRSIRFADSQTKSLAANLNPLPLDFRTASTVYYVVRQIANSARAYGTYFAQWDGSTHGPFVHTSSSTHAKGLGIGVYGSNIVDSGTTNMGLDTLIFRLTCDGSRNFTLTEVNQGITVTGTYPDLTGTMKYFVIGNNFNTGLQTGAPQDFYECAVFNEVLSITNQSAMEAYLQAKYATNKTLSRYVATFFESDQWEIMRAMTSPDGIAWDEIPAVFTPSIGTFRNGAATVRVGSYYYCAYPSLGVAGTTKTFGIARSSDFQTWTTIANPTVSATNCHVWSTGWWIDDTGNVYLLFSTDEVSSGHFVQYYITPTASDLTAWSAKTKVTGLDSYSVNSGDVYFNPDNGKYQLWYTNQDATGAPRYIEYAESTTPLTNYTRIKSGYWMGITHDVEASSLLRLGKNHWRCYVDSNATATTTLGMQYTESTDGQVTWSALASIDTPWSTPRAGMIVDLQV